MSNKAFENTFEDLTFEDLFGVERDDGLNFSTYPYAGVVKAKLTGVEDNVLIAIAKILRNHSKYLGVFRGYDNLRLPNQYNGKARANFTLGDSYDEKIGSDLARKRCMSKYHKNFDKRMVSFLTDVRTVLAAVEHYCDTTGIDYSNAESVTDIRAKRFNNT